MRKVVGVLSAALVIAGCATAPATSAPAAPTTVAPTAAPTASARWPTWFSPAAIADANGAGLLSAGSHATRVFRPGFSFSAPDGWVNTHDESNYFELFADTPANAAQFTRTGDLAQHIFMGSRPNPWFTCESLEGYRGATAAEIVAAMTAVDVLAVSGLVDVTIGGLTGRQLDVRRDPDWTGTCPGDSDLPAGVDPEDERTRVFFLDVPGRGVLVVFLYSASSAEHEAFLAEAMPIVESFEFSE
jgi:hypothetical protein